MAPRDHGPRIDTAGHPNDVDPQRAPTHGPMLEVDAADLIEAARQRVDPEHQKRLDEEEAERAAALAPATDDDDDL
jgi:hypothetical protein